MRRFYSPKENFLEQQIILDAEQTRHLQSVLRLKIGDEIQVFDGFGNEFVCKIETIEKKKTWLKIIKQIPPKSPESDLHLTLAVSILKGEKFDLVLQKAVELGVNKLVPLVTKRCDVKVKHSKLERWQKIIIEASKQCGRAKLMEIIEPIEFEEFINSVNESPILFSERNGESFSEIKADKKITAIIGSEGGWDDSEIEFAKENGVSIITLKGRILRAETAVISIASILQNHFGDFN